ncbi:MAG: DUF4982 domain-containing protein [Victivallales bacterium]|nr:DUF4982 domain-containing protein [Victivallales bacterium]
MRQTTLLKDGWLFRKGDTPPETAHAGEDGWQAVTIPHDWAIEGPFDGWNEPIPHLSPEKELSFTPGCETAALPYVGCGTYVRELVFGNDEKGRMQRLEFDGVMSHSKIFINGVAVGGRAYGYSSFAIDITPFLHFDGKPNLLAVRVENPPYLSRWYPGAGIYRDVRLVSLPQRHFAYMGVQLKTTHIDCVKKTAVLAVSADGFSADELHVTVKRHDDVIAEGGASLALSRVELWSPETPVLYDVTIAAGDDEITLAYGFRELSYDANNGMKLNGKPYKFKGLCMHHDLGVFGAAFHKEVMRWRLKKIKAIGCNALRMAHNPPDPHLLDLCDEMGFLVMDEAFDMWQLPKKVGDYHNEFDECHEMDLRDLLRRDRNHPCVALWSIGNEIRDEIFPKGAEIASELVRICHEEDPSRSVTAAISYQKAEDDPNVHAFAEALDVIGFNYKPDLYPLLHQRFPSKPIVGSETSAVVSTRGYYIMPAAGENIARESGYNSAYAVEFHPWSNDTEVMFRTIGANPWILGEFAWCTFDYLGEPAPHPYPNRSSCFALFDLAGLPKDRAFLYAAQWHTSNTPDVLHLLPHWNWHESDMIDVHTFTSCASAELFLNGKSLGLKECAKDSPRLVWKGIPFTAGTLEAIGYDTERRETARATRNTAGTPHAIGIRFERETCDTGGEFVFAELFLEDEHGNIVETSDAELTFALNGGTLIGVDNGDTRCLLPFKRSRVKLFNGHAMLTFWRDKPTILNVRCGSIYTSKTL